MFWPFMSGYNSHKVSMGKEGSVRREDPYISNTFRSSGLLFLLLSIPLAGLLSPSIVRALSPPKEMIFFV